MEKLLKHIPSDFPLTERPFEEVAGRVGMSEAELLHAVRRLQGDGIIRRFAAVLYHRRALYTHNAMVVWKVDEESAERAGRIMASFPEVSHCYEREKGDYWEYSLYTMIHGRNLEECMATVKAISEAANVGDYKMFFSKREFKKTALVARYG